MLSTKSTELLLDNIWNIAFYLHIILGGISLLIGWIQFSEKIRATNIKLHKIFGKIYVISALISGCAGIYIGFFATGGLIASLGFISLGIIWTMTTYFGYAHIRKGAVQKHEKLMYFSFGACFAAVTLRIWLPILTISFGDFIIAYKIVAWLCWVPNLLVAYYLLCKKEQKNNKINLSI
ncbi:DUF2306 domain-containing protein [Aquimarina litoralis]|uniref:DUF2306 domain-containing protein n=1 Tax=Aquimarina litoralis TaxID=584605 RepID=UPI001FE52B85|nr:DUF2306 domain-containing protein [Aquimarina litoralis]